MMRPQFQAGEISQGDGFLHALAHPMTPGARSRMKRIAGGTLWRLIHPLRAIKPLDWVVARAFQVWYEMPVTPTHFYSPLPDIAELKENLHHWYRQRDLTGIQMDFHKQTCFLDSLASYRDECDMLPKIDRVTAEGYGLGYGEVEAHFLHSIIRHVKPHKIIEVGSGVSTYFALNALEMNRQTDRVNSEMVCIEPYPRPKLSELVAQQKVTTFEQKVQDVPAYVFDVLGEGDILFIDSSHVSKVGSDVNFLFFDILPRLKKGVVVHIHDIPFPYLTCPPGHSMFEKSLLWNEAALLRAFLMWNEVFEILQCQSYLHLTCPDCLRRVAPIYDPAKHFPSSLWLRKTE
jgi:hypothetical protein